MGWSPIVVVGEALVDLVVTSESFDPADPSVPLGAALGGAPFNVARTAGRLGAEVEFVGALSSDAFGRALAAALAADGVGRGFVTETDAPTALAVAEVDAAGSATYRFHLAASSLMIHDPGSWQAAFAAAGMIVTGGLALSIEPLADALVDELTAMSTATATTGRAPIVILDLNHRPTVVDDPVAHRERLERVIAVADVIKASDEDLGGLWPERGIDEILRRTRRDVLQSWIVTRGGDDVEIHGDGWCHRIVPPAIDVVDTIGAGDAFVGALAAWWSHAGPDRGRLAERDVLVGAVSAAIEVAALTCTRRGADPPRRSELGPAWAQRSRRRGLLRR